MDKEVVLDSLGGERIKVDFVPGNTKVRNRNDFSLATNCCGAHRKQKYSCEMCQKDVTGEKSVNKLAKVGKKEYKVAAELLEKIDESLESMGDVVLRKQVAPPSDIADWYDEILYAKPADSKTGFQDYAKLARLAKGRWFEGSVVWRKNGYRVLLNSDGVVVRMWLLVDSAQRKPADIEALSGIVAKAKVDEEEIGLMQDILAKQASVPFDPNDGYRDPRVEAQEQLIEKVLTGEASVPTVVDKVVEEKRNEKLARLRALAGGA